MALAKAGYKFIGINIDREMIETASLNLAYKGLLSKAKFGMMDTRSLSFKNSSFDTIITVNTLHYLRKPRQIFLKVDRVLKEAGKLILANFNEQERKIVNLVYKEERQTYKDFFISKKNIYKIINSTGYKTRYYVVK